MHDAGYDNVCDGWDDWCNDVHDAGYDNECDDWDDWCDDVHDAWSNCGGVRDDCDDVGNSVRVWMVCARSSRQLTSFSTLRLCDDEGNAIGASETGGQADNDAVVP